MKILITHIPNTYNYGSAMMAINIISYLKKEIGNNIEFHTDCSSDDDLNRLKKSTNINEIKITSIDIKRNRKQYSNKGVKLLTAPLRAMDYNKRINEYTNNITREYDGVIVLGGDDLSEYYSKRNVVFELNRIRKLSEKTKVFLIGQTIGPFTSFRKFVAKNSLKNTYIYTRDINTYNFVKRNYNPRVVKPSADLAFLDLPNQHNLKKENLRALELQENQYITLVPSGIVKSYVNNEQTYIKVWVDIIKDLAQREELRNKKIVMLSHVLKPQKSDDRIIINKIYEALPEEVRGLIVRVDYPLLPEEAREILAGGIFTITGRMHSAVSTFQTRKPALSLSYSIKYSGVIGKGLGLENLIIESVGDSKWESGEIRNKVEEKVQYILTNYETLVNHIGNEVEKAKLQVYQQISDIAGYLKESSKNRGKDE